MIPCDIPSLTAELTADEGKRYRRYLCPAGKWTIGIGHNVEGKQFRPATWAAIKAEHPMLDNALLDDQVTLSEDLVQLIFADDVEDAVRDLDAIWDGWRDVSEARKRALINLSFQLGQQRLRAFVRFWRSMMAGAFNNAGDELKESMWYHQTQPSRTARVIAQVREG